MKTQSAKAKGRKLQQWVRDMILRIFYNHLEKDDVKSTSMGASGEDVQLSPKARALFPFSIECKSRNSIAVYSWLDQAKGNSDPNYIPILFMKANQRNCLVCMDAEEFLNIIGKHQRLRDLVNGKKD